jgi:DNA-binding NtrC family response regulator
MKPLPQELHLLGASSLMVKARERAQSAADTDHSVLLLGEPGVGKERVARTIHEASSRRGAFVPVVCGTDTSEPGAFAEKIASSDGGTLYLDGVWALPEIAAGKLSRALASSMGPRIIGAAKADKPGAVRDRLFPNEGAVRIDLPPLARRRGDIPELLEFCLDRLRKQQGRTIEPIQGSALGLLCAYHWPGNVRELENLVERLAVLVEHGRIDIKDLPEAVRSARTDVASAFTELPEEGIDFYQAIDRYETELIRAAMAKAGGNKARAARLLRLNRTTLLEKIKKKGLDEPW